MHDPWPETLVNLTMWKLCINHCWHWYPENKSSYCSLQWTWPSTCQKETKSLENHFEIISLFVNPTIWWSPCQTSCATILSPWFNSFIDTSQFKMTTSHWWQRMLGWANWGLNTYHFCYPALQACLCKKFREKPAKLNSYLNYTVIHHFHWLTDTIGASDDINMLDAHRMDHVTSMWHCWQTPASPKVTAPTIVTATWCLRFLGLHPMLELGSHQLPTLDSIYSLSLIYCVSWHCLPVFSFTLLLPLPSHFLHSWYSWLMLCSLTHV